MRSRSFRAALYLLAALTAPVFAQVVVPSGAAFSLGRGRIDLGSTSLQVGGSFDVGSGKVQNANSVAILSGCASRSFGA